MDSEQLLSLTSEIKGQLWLVKKVSDRLQSRISGGLDTPAQLDSVAYQIRNLYCSYGKDIELTQLQVNIAAAQKLYDLIAQDTDAFLLQIAPPEKT